MKIKVIISSLFGYACAMITSYLPPIGIMSGDRGVVLTTHHPVMYLYVAGCSGFLLYYAWKSYEENNKDIYKRSEREEGY